MTIRRKYNGNPVVMDDDRRLRKTIERQLKKLPNVHYKGSARDGEWVIDPSES